MPSLRPSPPEQRPAHEDTIQLRSPWIDVSAARIPRQADGESAPVVESARVVERVLTQPDPDSVAVFVDQSGRRGRALRRFGWAAGMVVGGFAATAVTTVAVSNAQAPAFVIPAPALPPASAVPTTMAAAPVPATPAPTGTASASPKITGRATTPATSTGRAKAPVAVTHSPTPGHTPTKKHS